MSQIVKMFKQYIVRLYSYIKTSIILFLRLEENGICFFIRYLATLSQYVLNKVCNFLDIFSYLSLILRKTFKYIWFIFTNALEHPYQPNTETLAQPIVCVLCLATNEHYFLIYSFVKPHPLVTVANSDMLHRTSHGN